MEKNTLCEIFYRNFEKLNQTSKNQSKTNFPENGNMLN